MLRTLVNGTQFSTKIIMAIDLFSLKLFQALSKGKTGSWKKSKS